MDDAALRWSLEFLDLFFAAALFFYIALSRRGIR